MLISCAQSLENTAPYARRKAQKHVVEQSFAVRRPRGFCMDGPPAVRRGWMSCYRKRSGGGEEGKDPHASILKQVTPGSLCWKRDAQGGVRRRRLQKLFRTELWNIPKKEVAEGCGGR